MNRRELLKLLGGAVAVAAFPLPTPAPDLRPEFYREGDSAFIVITAPHNVRAAEFILWRGVPLGVAMATARRGQRVVAQVYGPTTVRPAPR